MLKSPAEVDALSSRIAPRLRSSEHALVAMDAPLGWPIGLAASLTGHQAGQPVDGDSATLFNRETDRIVAERIRKRPLDVGADKIARAAHTGLGVLARLRDLTGYVLPLAWDSGYSGRAVIEVYPAATLKSRGLPDSGYKKAEEIEVRRRIARAISDEVPELVTKCRERADIFDACLCLIAAKDFLDGVAMPPDDVDLARREGWIWVRARDQ